MWRRRRCASRQRSQPRPLHRVPRAARSSLPSPRHRHSPVPSSCRASARMVHRALLSLLLLACLAAGAAATYPGEEQGPPAATRGLAAWPRRRQLRRRPPPCRAVPPRQVPPRPPVQELLGAHCLPQCTCIPAPGVLPLHSRPTPPLLQASPPAACPAPSCLQHGKPKCIKVDPCEGHKCRPGYFCMAQVSGAGGSRVAASPQHPSAAAPASTQQPAPAAPCPCAAQDYNPRCITRCAYVKCAGGNVCKIVRGQPKCVPEPNPCAAVLCPTPKKCIVEVGAAWLLGP